MHETFSLLTLVLGDLGGVGKYGDTLVPFGRFGFNGGGVPEVVFD